MRVKFVKLQSNLSKIFEKELNLHALEFKKKMLEWPNPVEFVNNMYGCHPSHKGSNYFTVCFSLKEIQEDKSKK